MTRRWRRCTAGGVAVVAVSAVVTWYAWPRHHDPAADASTVEANRGAVTATVSATGTVQPATTRGLSFSLTGTVTAIAVKAGDLVTAGQVLARIDTADAAEAVTEAQADVDDAEDALDAAEEAAEEATEAAAEAAEAAATVAATPTAAPSASASSGPAAGGGGSGATPGGGSGTGGTAGGSGRSAGDAIFTAQQQLNNARLVLKQAQRKLAGTTITAPIAGRVLSVGGAVGSEVSPGGTGFIVLADVSGLQVRAQFSEADVGRLAVGQVTAVTVASREGETLAAKVSEVAATATTSNRLVTYQVRLAFDTLPDGLMTGQSATAAVTVAEVTDVVRVPPGALRPLADGGAEVTVVTGTTRSARRVEVGLRGDAYVEIRSGLSAGETVLAVGR
jgi:HlyD family secretion protein